MFRKLVSLAMLLAVISMGCGNKLPETKTNEKGEILNNKGQPQK